jgi:hypothetical protein
MGRSASWPNRVGISSYPHHLKMETESISKTRTMDTDQINRPECVIPMATNLGWNETAAHAPKIYSLISLKITIIINTNIKLINM